MNGDGASRKDPGEVGKATDVVEVVVGEKEMDLARAFDQVCVTLVCESAQARARVEDEQRIVITRGEAGCA